MHGSKAVSAHKSSAPSAFINDITHKREMRWPLKILNGRVLIIRCHALDWKENDSWAGRGYEGDCVSLLVSPPWVDNLVRIHSSKKEASHPWVDKAGLINSKNNRKVKGYCARKNEINGGI